MSRLLLVLAAFAVAAPVTAQTAAPRFSSGATRASADRARPSAGDVVGTPIRCPRRAARPPAGEVRPESVAASERARSVGGASGVRGRAVGDRTAGARSGEARAAAASRVSADAPAPRAATSRSVTTLAVPPRTRALR